MKIVILFLSFSFSVNCVAQFRRLNTTIFDKTIFEEVVEPNIKTLKLEKESSFLLYSISLYNSYVGSLLKGEEIQPEFYFASDSSISSIDYFFCGDKITVTSPH